MSAAAGAAWTVRLLESAGSTNAVASEHPVPGTIVLADPCVVVPRRAAQQYRSYWWDVRTLPGAHHDLHIQMPAALAAALDDILTARPGTAPPMV